MHIEQVLVQLVRIRRGAEVEEEGSEGGAGGGGGVGREEVACGFVEDDWFVECRHREGAFVWGLGVVG